MYPGPGAHLRCCQLTFMTSEKDVSFSPSDSRGSYSLERVGKVAKVSSQEEERSGFQMRLLPGQH